MSNTLEVSVAGYVSFDFTSPDSTETHPYITQFLAQSALPQSDIQIEYTDTFYVSPNIHGGKTRMYRVEINALLSWRYEGLETLVKELDKCGIIVHSDVFDPMNSQFGHSQIISQKDRKLTDWQMRILKTAN